jgi:hypothetical protein
MTEQNNTKLRNRMMVTAIFLLFLLPVLLARFVMFNTSYKHDAESGTQHGILINPPRALENRDLVDPVSGMKASLRGKWTMFAQIEGDCNRECKDVLYRMRQIQIAMGEKFYRVQRAVYFVNADTEKNANKIFSGFEGQLVLAHDNAGADFRKNFLVVGGNTDHAIYLIDPRGFLMMCYPKETNPSGMIKDLQHLLRASG